MIDWWMSREPNFAHHLRHVRIWIEACGVCLTDAVTVEGAAKRWGYSNVDHVPTKMRVSSA
jgi:D-arabinose 1-dehydrogenase-like Zn-dependent alcohol dehydrogenase